MVSTAIPIGLALKTSRKRRVSGVTDVRPMRTYIAPFGPNGNNPPLFKRRFTEVLHSLIRLAVAGVSSLPLPQEITDRCTRQSRWRNWRVTPHGAGDSNSLRTLPHRNI